MENLQNLYVGNAKLKKIPTEIVEMLDATDSNDVDTSYPPRFDCEKCSGKMVPIYYINVHGKIHEYKEK